MSERDYPARNQPEHVEYAEYRMDTGAAGRTEPQPGSEEDRRAYDPLFSPERADQLRAEWEDIQVAFVQNPRQAMQDADQLVGSTLDEISRQFAEERESLESQIDAGEDISTEELRVILQRYRSFFNRLLSV